MASSNYCNCKQNIDTTSSIISDCISTLLEVSELSDPKPQRQAASTKSLCPWIPKHCRTPSPSRPKGKRRKSSSLSPRRRPHSTPVNLIDCSQCPFTRPKKSTKFRGVLRTLLSSERQRAEVEETFEHLSDTADYIQQYRAHRQCRSSATHNDDVNPDLGSMSQNSTERVDENSTTSGTGNVAAAKRCSRADRGCPHYTPRSPCVKTARHLGLTGGDPSSRPIDPCGTSTSKISVKGKQMDSGSPNRLQEDRHRPKFCFSKDRKTIVFESRNCKRIRMSWRQYVKYFSNIRSTHRNATHNDEHDNDGGYTERPATPSRPKLARASTCIPILDYDQSRVGSPDSPFKVDHSKARNAMRSASSPAASASEVFSLGRGLKTATCARLTICTVMDIQEAIQQLALSLKAKSSRLLQV